MAQWQGAWLRYLVIKRFQVVSSTSKARVRSSTNTHQRPLVRSHILFVGLCAHKYRRCPLAKSYFFCLFTRSHLLFMMFHTHSYLSAVIKVGHGKSHMLHPWVLLQKGHSSSVWVMSLWTQVLNICTALFCVLLSFSTRPHGWILHVALTACVVIFICDYLIDRWDR
jgi:hypothetical protein